MGLFGFLKGKKGQETAPGAKKFGDLDFDTIYSQSLGKMLVFQHRASDLVVKGRSWNLDLRNGFISFGEDVYPVQFIGSESSVSNTWMWGWNNINKLPDNLLFLARQMKDLGNHYDIRPLKLKSFEIMKHLDGHDLSIVACGMSGRDLFYYKCPHSNGAAFVAVENAPPELFAPVDLQQFVEFTIRCIEQYPADHKIFAEGFLEWNQTAYEWDGDTLIAHFEQDLLLEFKTKKGIFYIANIKI